jgi:succinate dehydrogenase/fumarate reductase cytochrome b subunit
MKKIVSAISVMGLVYAVPMVAAAQSLSKVSTFFKELSTLITGTLIPLMFAVALLVFLWGAIKYFIIGGSDETKRAEGRQLMLYSVIAFVLMVSIWGIVAFVQQVFGIDGNNRVNIPEVPTRTTGGGSGG